MFKAATRETSRLRLCLDGPAGAGKTYTALRVAFLLAGPGGRVAVIDTEHGSASKYLGESPDGIRWQWDQVRLQHFAPTTYVTAIQAAAAARYDVLVIDSLSHAWMGVGGALDQIDRKDPKERFFAWRDVTPQHTAMIEAILQSPCHVIATMRTKVEYVVEKDEKTGKNRIEKYGMKPVQREGMEYEFDLVADLDVSHTCRVSKSRCPALDSKIFSKPGVELAEPLKRWLAEGSPPAEAAAFHPASAPAPAQISPAPTPAAPTNGTQPVRLSAPEPEHAARVKQLAAEAKWPVDRLREEVAKLGVTRLAESTAEQAAPLIAALERECLRAAGDAAF